MARLKSFAYFWYDFIVGDDWLIAAGVVAALVITWAAARRWSRGVAVAAAAGDNRPRNLAVACHHKASRLVHTCVFTIDCCRHNAERQDRM